MRRKRTLTGLAKKAREVTEKLNWQVYHTPENLTLFLVGEASELGEFCQWYRSTEELRNARIIQAVIRELADVVKSVLYLANVLPLAVSLETLLVEKISLDEREYPVEEFRGRHRYVLKTAERRKRPVPALPTASRGESPALSRIERRAWDFVERRQWEAYYSPASLALAICVKSGEVATSYQRRPKPVPQPYERIIWALADILLNAIRFCRYLDMADVHRMVLEKFTEDARRFAQPVRA